MTDEERRQQAREAAERLKHIYGAVRPKDAPEAPEPTTPGGVVARAIEQGRERR